MGIFDRSSKTSITVTSSSLSSDGVWADVISKKRGRNVTPQLSWGAVDGAKSYAIYMIDTSAGNWLHWRVKGTTKTTLAQGEKIPRSEYVGPYPPSGVHTYVIHVYALASEPDSWPGDFDATNRSVPDMRNALDTAAGKQGNILSEGLLSGTFKA